MIKQTTARSKRLFSLLVCLLLFATVTFAQRTVSGSVIDSDTDEPLIGASVFVKGTSTGTVTDFNGEYSLTVPDDATTLVVSYTGFGEQERSITGSTMDFTMSAGTLLDDVVVVGYGTVKKSDLTGSVGSVKAEDFNQGIVTAPDQLIQGKVAGVQILNNSGQPGGGTTVRIRGNSSVRTGNQPLYVVDGVPLDGRSARPGLSATDLGESPSANPLNFINPNDIASIEVLKDASAAAIYGARGANGVVIITTKKGRNGDPTIELNMSLGTSSLLKNYDVLDANAFKAAVSSYGITPEDGGSSVDALDAVLQNGLTQNYNLSIGGGNDNGNYRISAGILNQEGIVQESGIKKYTGSLNGNFKVLKSKRLNLSYNLTAGHTSEDIAPITNNAGFTGSLIGQALQWNPTLPLTSSSDPTGFNILYGTTTINPLAMNAAYSDVANTTTLLGSLSPSFDITDKLQYKYLFSVNYGIGERRSSQKAWINQQNVEGRGIGRVANSTLSTKQHTHTLSYTDDITSSINLNAVVGYEYQKFSFEGFGAEARDFVNDDLDYTYILASGSNESKRTNSFADPISELQSYFGRVNLNLGDRFLVTGTVRADGSSKFGVNNKYGVFPSAAVAWKLSNESFLEGGFFDDLKLRVGWGQTGNQEFPAGASVERYTLDENGASRQVNVNNPDLKWETSTTFNVGLDFAILDYVLSGSIDFFNKNTTDLLFNLDAIQPAPATKYWANLDGNVINTGVELGLNAFVINTDAAQLNIGGNIAFLSNELQNYVGPTILTGGLHGQGSSGATSQRLANGEPLNSFYLATYNGLTDDGTNDLGDPEFVGDPNPDVLLGINADLSFGNLSFVMNWNGAYGHQIFNNTRMSVVPIGNLIGSRNIDASLLEGSVTESLANPIQPSARYLEDGSYTKLSNATLAYNLGDIAGFSNARIYLTGSNLLVLTDFSGFDPEVNVDKQVNGVPSFGIEYIPYPSARSFIVGASVSF